MEEAPSTLLAPLPSSGMPVRCWLVGPSPMAFENIGFSRAVVPLSANEDPSNCKRKVTHYVCLSVSSYFSLIFPAKRLKLLSCADCDLGPLGWSEEGGHAFWVLCARVGYHVREPNTR